MNEKLNPYVEGADMRIKTYPVTLLGYGEWNFDDGKAIPFVNVLDADADEPEVRKFTLAAESQRLDAGSTVVLDAVVTKSRRGGISWRCVGMEIAPATAKKAS